MPSSEESNHGDARSLEWLFKTASKNIGFAVHFESSGQQQIVRELQVMECSDCPEMDGLACDAKGGTYHLIWDNTHSYLRSKSLLFKLTLPKGAELVMI